MSRLTKHSGAAAGLTLLLALLGLLCCGGCRARSSSPAAAVAAPGIAFEDVTERAGLRFTRENGVFGKKWLPETMGGGGGFVDFDADGWPDIALVNGDFWPGHRPAGKKSPPLVSLFHNNRDGTFVDVTAAAGLQNVHGYGMGLAAGDYDGDGFDDLFVTAVGQARLFRNVPGSNGARRFVEVTNASGIRDAGWSTSAAWLDYDGDNRLDLFVCHYLKWTPATDRYCGAAFKAYCGPQVYAGESCRLYRNRGGGRFQDVTRAAGLYSDESKALGVCVRDLDGDNRPDLIVTNDTTPNNLYRNNGDGTFSDQGLASGIAFGATGTARAGMGVDVADYGREGALGLVIGNFSQEGLAFYDVSAAGAGGDLLADDRARASGVYGPSYPLLAFGLFFDDLNNDGWPDLFVTNGHVESDIRRIRPEERFAQPCLVFRGAASGVFRDVSRAAGTGVTDPLVGRGASRADFDNDGKTDVLVTSNGGGPRLLRNVCPDAGPPAHWLTLKLVGTPPNRGAVGATISVRAGGRTRSAYVGGGSSYLSAHDARAHFGLGASAVAERVTVTWPGGQTETWDQVRADQILTLRQGDVARTGPAAR